MTAHRDLTLDQALTAAQRTFGPLALVRKGPAFDPRRDPERILIRVRENNRFAYPGMKRAEWEEICVKQAHALMLERRDHRCEVFLRPLGQRIGSGQTLKAALSDAVKRNPGLIVRGSIYYNPPEPGDCTGHHTCRCDACRWVSRRDNAPPSSDT